MVELSCTYKELSQAFSLEQRDFDLSSWLQLLRYAEIPCADTKAVT